jgi:hypothetical protein
VGPCIGTVDAQSLTSEFNVSMNFRLSAVAISLTVEKPVRREFMTLYLELVDGKH